MARSATILNTDTIPTWARYAVVLCHSHVATHRPEHDTIQVFSSRAACDRFTLAISRYFPLRSGDALTMWALAYALPKVRRYTVGYSGVRGGICYLAVDPGARVLKRHKVPDGYGVSHDPEASIGAW